MNNLNSNDVHKKGKRKEREKDHPQAFVVVVVLLPINKTENSNSNTLILKDSNIRSIWTYLTASHCYTTKVLN